MLSQLLAPQSSRSSPVTTPPVLSADAPTAVVAFAGGGGVEGGLVSAGVRPIASVELDPEFPGLSGALADANDRNYARYSHRVIRRDICDCAADLPRADIFHASPVCTRFSTANTNRGEKALDLKMANAVVTAIDAVSPKFVTIENVPAYAGSESWQTVGAALFARGYWVATHVLNAADFGVPQSRKRFFVIAAKGQLPPSIAPSGNRVGWYDAIADFIDTLEAHDNLVPRQREAIADRHDRPLLIQRSGYNQQRGCRVLRRDEPLWTITRCIADDSHRANRDKMVKRTKFIDLALADGTFRRADGRCLARWGGFPDWYEFPDSVSVTGSIVGYSVPPPMYAAIASVMVGRQESQSP